MRLGSTVSSGNLGAELVVFLVNAVLPDDLSAAVTEQGKGHTVLVGKDSIGKRVIHAHTQDLGVCAFQLG